eukprot:2103148-Pyramimonas_sp.AAC.1
MINHVPGRLSGDMICWGVLGGLLGVPWEPLGDLLGLPGGLFGPHWASWGPLGGLRVPTGSL